MRSDIILTYATIELSTHMGIGVLTCMEIWISATQSTAWGKEVLKPHGKKGKGRMEIGSQPHNQLHGNRALIAPSLAYSSVQSGFSSLTCGVSAQFHQTLPQ
jgi:hypothetical protein